MRVVCIYFLKEAPTQNISEALLKWSPQIAMSKKAIFLEISRCHKLYTESELIPKLYEICEHFEQKPIISVGPDIPTSLALAHFRLKDKWQLPAEALSFYIDPFNYDRSADRLIEALDKLGAHSLRSFAHLPVRALPQRFGKLGLLLRQRVIDSSHLPWPYFRPKEVLTEAHQFEFTDRVQNLEPLLFVMNKLIDRTLLRLQGRSHALSKVKLLIKLEKTDITEDSERTWQVEFPLPQTKLKNILDIFRDKLQFDLQKSPLESLVEEMTLTVLESAPAPANQKDFFSKKEEQQEAWASLVARLAEKVGKKHVFCASPHESYRPECSWKKVPCTSLAPQKVKELPPRPLRLLNNPMALQQLDDFLVLNQRRWRVTQWSPPEHISGEWWQAKNFNRDYFCVNTESGEQLWVFKEHGAAQYYLHGVFD